MSYTASGPERLPVSEAQRNTNAKAWVRSQRPLARTIAASTETLDLRYMVGVAGVRFKPKSF